MIGTTLGPYRVDRELGSGGMGRVYAATGPDGATVALKVVHAHLLEQPGFRERFLREARSGLAITSPNVVRTMECLETEADGACVLALVLEYVEGRELAALLGESRCVPEDLCRHLGREIARGLDAIHAAGIVHRDLKPGNVLMTTAGDVKVMDLGLARQASGDDRMSQSGLFLGTAAYAPPEQFFGKKDLDPRSDLYSLGAMLFELATGRVPFQAEAIGDLVRQVMRDKAPRLGTLAPQVTPFFEEVVATLLEKQPERRFATAAELGEVLDDAESGDWWAAASVRMQLDSRKPLRRVRVHCETELWGREDDLAELRSLWEAARGGKGAVVLLEGEAGIGKTRLVEELLAAIEAEDDAQILVGRHDPAGAGTAAEALGAAFREHLGAEDLDARLRELLPDTPLLVPAFAALLVGEAPPPDALALTSESLRTLFVHLARALAAEAPLVLVVDDLHLASDDGRALFRAVALAVEGHRVLLVGTARPGLPAKWVEATLHRGNATRHEVRRLDVDTVQAALVRHLGTGWEAESVAEKIASQAGGNPYFVVEALRHLCEQGALARTADGTWRVTSVPADLALPATVRDLVAKRLAALASADREVLEAASCQGHEFDGRLVAEALGRPRIEVLRALGRLENATKLVRAAGTRFAFDHHVVHEVLYTGQPEGAKQGRHGAIGGALEARHGAASKEAKDLDGALCVQLAEHLLRGVEGSRALRYLAVAQAYLEKRHLNAQAVALAERALAAPGLLAGAERARALLRVGAIRGPLDRLGRRARHAEVAEEAERLAEAAGEVELRGAAAQILGIALERVARHAEAVASLRTAHEIARSRGDRAAEAAAEGGLGSVHLSQGRFGDAHEHFDRVLGIFREIGDLQGEANSSGNLGVVCRFLGRLTDAQEHQARTIALCRAIGYRQGEANATGNLGSVRLAQGRLAEAWELYERDLAMQRQIGDRTGEAVAAGNLGSIASAQGRLREARQHHERHLAISRECGNRQGEAIALVNLGPVGHQLGDSARARHALQASLEICREIGDPYPEGYGLLDLGSLTDEEGDAAEALRLMEESLALRRRIGHGDGVLDSLIQIADMRRRSGDAEAARTALDEALRLAREQGRAPELALALAILACLERGEVEAAVAALAEAGENMHSPRARWLLWQATGDRSHLAEGKRLLDESLAKVPAEHHAAMLANVRLNREIAAAAKAAGL